MLDQRGQLLFAALGFTGLPRLSSNRVLSALRVWLDSWAGIGHIVVGMARQGYDLQLTRYDERGWRATFYTTGMEHSPTSATGTAQEQIPWEAVRRAWDIGSGGVVFDESLRLVLRHRPGHARCASINTAGGE